MIYRWHPAPKQPGRWVLIEPGGLEMQADVEQKGPYVLAKTYLWPGTEGRMFDTLDATWGTSIINAKRWCEQSLELPVCEDAI